jgi:hypothetical protein
MEQYIQALRETNCQPRILYPAKLSFNLDGETRTFQDKDKLKWLTSNKPALQKILKGVLHTEEEEKQSQHKRSGRNQAQRGINKTMRARTVSSMITQ